MIVHPFKFLAKLWLILSLHCLLMVGNAQAHQAIIVPTQKNAANSNLLHKYQSVDLKPDTLIIPALDSLKTLLTDSIKTADTLKGKAKEMLETKVERTAQDSIIQDLKNHKVYLYGNAMIIYGDIKLEAAYIEFSFDNNQVLARGVADSTGKLMGTPKFTEKTQTFESKEMTYNFETKKGIINSVVTEDGSGFLHGQQVKKMTDNSINIKGGLLYYL